MEGTGRWKALAWGRKRVGRALEVWIEREASVIKMQSISCDADRSASKKRRIGHRRCRKSGGAEKTAFSAIETRKPFRRAAYSNPAVKP